MLENIECDVTPSDLPNTMVYVHHYPAEGDDALLLEEFRRYGKIVSVKHQYFAGRPNLLTGSRVLTMSLSQQIPAEVFVDSYPTRGIAEWHRFVRSAKPWATKPRIVNISGNAESVAMPVIWLGHVRPAGVGAFGGMVLFWPTLPPRWMLSLSRPLWPPSFGRGRCP